jgi:hypothetical protein
MVIFRLVFTETRVSQPLASNGLFRFSGVMSQYYNILRKKVEWKGGSELAQDRVQWRDFPVRNEGSAATEMV